MEKCSDHGLAYNWAMEGSKNHNTCKKAVLSERMVAKCFSGPEQTGGAVLSQIELMEKCSGALIGPWYVLKTTTHKRRLYNLTEWW